MKDSFQAGLPPLYESLTFLSEIEALRRQVRRNGFTEINANTNLFRNGSES